MFLQPNGCFRFNITFRQVEIKPIFNCPICELGFCLISLILII